MNIPEEARNGFPLKKFLCLICCPPWPSKIAEKIAFKPPQPSYNFSSDSSEKYCITLFEKGSCITERDKEKLECFYANTSRGNRIACVYVRCHTDVRYTFLFSHGNASDLGIMLPFYLHLGNHVRCNIFSYDYSGYGVSSGRPSEKNMYADIECAWDILKTRFAVSPEQIILYGQSLGTVPTVDLASRFKVAAVVLHSPLTSALRVAYPEIKRTWCCDTFLNIEKVPKIFSPVLVIHGNFDEIVPFSHGLDVFEKCPHKVDPLWVHGAGHNTIECRREYLERMKKFVNIELEEYGKDKVQEETIQTTSE